MTNGYQLVWRNFPALRLDELYGLLRLRQDVFILEQQSFYLDLDGRDETARHLLVRAPLGGADMLVGTLRLLPPRQDDGTVWIGRVALAREVRGQGLGAEMMRAALTESNEIYGAAPVALSAQIQQENFYRKFGFLPRGESYDDGGIAHIDMYLKNPDILKG